jgi:hypothetical protein
MQPQERRQDPLAERAQTKGEDAAGETGSERLDAPARAKIKDGQDERTSDACVGKNVLGYTTDEG